MRSHTSYRWRGERHRANQVYALTTPATGGERESHRANQVYALTTHSYRWRGERVIEPIKCMRSTHQLQVERRET